MSEQEIKELEIRIKYLERENAALKRTFLDECALDVTQSLMTHPANLIAEYATIESKLRRKNYSVMQYVAMTSYDMAEALLAEKLSRKQ